VSHCIYVLSLKSLSVNFVLEIWNLKFQAENEQAKAEQEERAAIAAGKKKCPRCSRWIKDDMKNHLYKCWHCDRCDTYVTNKGRHQKSCKGPEQPEPKSEKVPCPICTESVHPCALIRHLKRRHPEQVEHHRKRTASGKTPKEKRQNRKRFREAHPEKVNVILCLSSLRLRSNIFSLTSAWLSTVKK